MDIFLPTIVIGVPSGCSQAYPILSSLLPSARTDDHACSQGLWHMYPAVWLISTCPLDPTVRCMSPRFYTVIGMSAMLDSVTRMTSECSLPTHSPPPTSPVSLVVILFEVHPLPFLATPAPDTQTTCS